MAVSEKTRIFRTGDEVELRALADHLESEGVEVHMAGDSMVSGPYGVVGADLTANLELWTSEHDVQRAKALIALWNREHHPDRDDAVAPPLRYSLKSLLLIMTVVAVASAVAATQGSMSTAMLLAIAELGLIVYAAYRWRWSQREAASDAERDQQDDDDTMSDQESQVR